MAERLPLGAILFYAGAGMVLGALADHVLVRKLKAGCPYAKDTEKSSLVAGTVVNTTSDVVTVAVAGPPPQPNWKPGEKQPHPFGEDCARLALDPSALASSYWLVISVGVPRPIAFISSVDATGSRNLAPYSYFNMMGHNPPLVCVSICRKATGKKDTLSNIEATGTFVVSIISEWFIAAANHCCGDFPPEVDEFTESGLTPMPATKVAAPLVKEAAVNMECKVVHTYESIAPNGQPSATLVIGEVLLFHVLEPLLDPESVKKSQPVVLLEKLQPIGRLGGSTYGRTTSTFDLPRPPRTAINRA